MIAKFNIEYVLHPHHSKRVDSHRTDDPVEAEDFLIGLLESGARVVTIKHEGVDLEPKQSDRMLKVASERMVSRLLGEALGIDSAQVNHRFGYAA